MVPHILIWGFIGLYVGHLVSQYIEGRQWNGYNGDLTVGTVGSLLGGLDWLHNGQPEQLLGSVLYAAIGALALLLISRVVIHRPARQQLLYMWLSNHRK